MSATGTLTAAVSTEATTRASETGALNTRVTTTEAQYVLKAVATRSDGTHVVGAIGLASTASGSAGESVIVLQADRLTFVPSSNPDATPSQLMQVGTVNGVTTLIVQAARIGDATITPGKMSVTNLAAISADLGSVRISSSGGIIAGMSSYGVGSPGFALGYYGGEYSFLIGDKAGGGAYLEYKPSIGLVLHNATLAGIAASTTGGDQFVDATVVNPSDTVGVVAAITFRTDGTIYQTISVGNGTGANSVTKVGDWYLPTTTGIGSSYDIRFDRVAGSNASYYSSNVGWSQATSDQQVSLTRVSGPTFFTETAFGNYTVRRRSDNAQAVSGAFTLGIHRET